MPTSTLPTILIIENDIATLNLYRRELSRDFAVIACSSKNEALQTITSKNLDAVVLEPAALNGEGWTLLESILAQRTEHARVLPTVLCSVLDERKRGLEMGATIFLVKPVLPLQLLETLHQVIGKTEITE